MEHRTLGRSGLKVSRLSLGAMTFGASQGFMKGVTSDEKEARRVLGEDQTVRTALLGAACVRPGDQRVDQRAPSCATRRANRKRCSCALAWAQPSSSRLQLAREGESGEPGVRREGSCSRACPWA